MFNVSESFLSQIQGRGHFYFKKMKDYTCITISIIEQFLKHFFFHNSKTKSVLSDISKHFFCFYVRIFVSNILKTILCNYVIDLHELCSSD